MVPYVGTYRDIIRAYDNPTVNNVVSAVISTGADVIGAGIAGKLAKGISKYSKVAKALKNNGYFRPTNVGTQWIKVGTKKVPLKAGKFGTIGFKTEPAAYVKNLPEPDLAPTLMYNLGDGTYRTLKTISTTTSDGEYK